MPRAHAKGGTALDFALVLVLLKVALRMSAPRAIMSRVLAYWGEDWHTLFSCVPRRRLAPAA